MKIVMMGSGGVGGYFGARLALGGADVTFVARGAHLAAMRDKGLLLDTPQGAVQVPEIRVVEQARDAGVADFVLLAVKLWDTEQALQQIRPIVGPATTVISLQNGVHKEELLGQAFAPERLMGGVAYVAARIAQPGVIKQTGPMQRLQFGDYDAKRSARAQALLAACLKGGINAEIADDIRRVIWEKYVFLAALSGATTAIRKTIGPIRSHPQTRAFFLDLMREVVAVGRAKGVALPQDFAEQRLKLADDVDPGMTSSMHHDLDAGTRLELRWLSGGVVELGAQLGVATPLHRAVYDILVLHAGEPP
ncbi:MAG: 2-dehydropantoate 2-reductase [Burkholderiaceae bacterium]